MAELGEVVQPAHHLGQRGLQTLSLGTLHVMPVLPPNAAAYECASRTAVVALWNSTQSIA
jgi:hypothetical protein